MAPPSFKILSHNSVEAKRRMGIKGAQLTFASLDEPKLSGNCEVVASTDGASAHTAHFLSTTQMSCVLTTIYCKSSVAAGVCPTESMQVVETKSDSTQGVPDVPRLEMFLDRTDLSKTVDRHGTERCHVLSRSSRFLAAVLFERQPVLVERGHVLTRNS